jgi:DNA-binding transcriptional ArsR family regulator
MTSTPSPSEHPPPDVVQDAAATFGLLAASVRLELLWLLSHGERDVGTLASAVGESIATVSHHLGKLKLAGLVTARRAGKHQIYAAADPEVVDLVGRAIDHHRRLREAPSPRRGRRWA